MGALLLLTLFVWGCIIMADPSGVDDLIINTKTFVALRLFSYSYLLYKQ